MPGTRRHSLASYGVLLAAVVGTFSACSMNPAPLAGTSPDESSESGVVFLERPALGKPTLLAWLLDTEVVTPEAGGTLQIGNGWVGYTTLVVPPGAVTEPVTITMNYHSIGRVMVDLKFQPSGLQFQKAAWLTLSYAGAKFEKQIERKLEKAKISGLTIYELNEDTGGWIPVQGAVWDQQAQTVSAPIWHFSRYAIGGEG